MSTRYENIAGTGWSLGETELTIDAASEEHRKELQAYDRTRAINKNITVSWSDDGSSHTDMRGTIHLANRLHNNPHASAIELYLAIEGLNEHELCHERWTHGESFKQMLAEIDEVKNKVGKDAHAAQDALNAIPEWEELGELTRAIKQLNMMLGAATRLSDTAGSNQCLAELAKMRARVSDIHAANPNIKKLAKELHTAMTPVHEMYELKDDWNIIEDGRIETHLRHFEPSSYRLVSYLNMINPRVEDTWEAGKYNQDPEADPNMPLVVEKVDGSVPVDIDGKSLHAWKDDEGTEWFGIFPGDVLDMWGEQAYDPSRQLRAALLADAVPEFSVKGKLHPKVRACFDECKPVIAKATTSDGALTYGFAKDIFEIVKKHGLLGVSDEPLEGKQPPGSGGIPMPGGAVQSGGEAGDERGDAGGQGDGVSESSGNAEAGGAGGGKMSEKDREKDDRQGGATEGDLQQAKKDAGDKLKEQSKAAGGEEDGRHRGEVSGDTWQNGNGQSVTGYEQIAARGRNIEITGEHTQYSNRFAHELEDILMLTRSSERHQRAGRLERKRLPAAVAGNEYVFYRPGENREIDMAVEIVLDISGSMSHLRGELADAALTCHLALKKINVPHGIWGYSSDSREANHYEFKKITDEHDVRGLAGLGDRSSGKWYGTYWGGGGTPTAQAIDFATARLHLRSEESKVMVVFTDGCPNDVEATKRAVRRAQDKNILIIGVYLGHDSGGSMRRLFKEDYVEIEDLSEMPPYLGRRIKKMVKSPHRAYEDL